MILILVGKKNKQKQKQPLTKLIFLGILTWETIPPLI